MILVLFPLVVAILLLFTRSASARRPVVITGAAVIAAFSIYFAITNFGGEQQLLWDGASRSSEIVGYVMMGIEAVLALLIIVLGIVYKKYLASLLAVIQTPLLIWFEFWNHGRPEEERFEVTFNLAIDNFSLIMVLIIGIIGTLITVFAVGYMKDFAHHHAGQKDHSPFFFFIMYVFLSAMFGIVLSNNLIFMYFFWEITTLSSFFLIGYTMTPEAIKNAFRALIMNLLGGLAFCVAIVTYGYVYGIVELNKMIEMGMPAMPQNGGQGLDIVTTVVVTLLAFAGLTKAAQMPFNSWLLGAMVAPTPTSALLHSSTMVKAGVFLIIKLSPLLGVTSIISIGPGFMVVMIGGGTFLLASMAAVSQHNAKRVLAYSTIANLGLICACAGLGTAEGVWAAIMLVIFHAVTKSMLFLSVGTAEHNIGSRDIEDMDGLLGRMPRLALFMIIGIGAMFLAPFGMLISKWAALQSFIDAGNVWVILFVCFGSAVTLFYWGKWLGKLTGIIANRKNIQDKVNGEEWAVIGTHAGLVVLISLGFPLISDKLLLPYLDAAAPGGLTNTQTIALSSDNMLIMVVMVALILVLPLLFYGHSRKKLASLYMAGTGEGNDLTFRGSMNAEVPVSLRNWYMEDVFKEKRMNRIGLIYSCLILAISFSYAISMGVYILQNI
jgi:ech hydrogenase subunit A